MRVFVYIDVTFLATCAWSIFLHKVSGLDKSLVWFGSSKRISILEFFGSQKSSFLFIFVPRSIIMTHVFLFAIEREVKELQLASKNLLAYMSLSTIFQSNNTHIKHCQMAAATMRLSNS